MDRESCTLKMWGKKAPMRLTSGGQPSTTLVSETQDGCELKRMVDGQIIRSWMDG